MTDWNAETEARRLSSTLDETPWEEDVDVITDALTRAYDAGNRDAENEASINRRSTMDGVVTVMRDKDGDPVWSWCAEHGPDVSLDGEGCCATCGEDALFYGRMEDGADGYKAGFAAGKREGAEGMRGRAVAKALECDALGITSREINALPLDDPPPLDAETCACGAHEIPRGFGSLLDNRVTPPVRHFRLGRRCAPDPDWRPTLPLEDGDE